MILYKYMSAKALKSALTKKTLRFSNPNFFNDPYDCALSTSDEQHPTDKSFITNILSRTHRDRSGVLCLTRNQFNLLMWAHYGENHEGAVIGIDTTEAGLDCEQQNIIPAKSGSVIYTSVRPTPTDMQLEVNMSANSDRGTLEKLFLHKSIHWAYEEEVRVVKCINPEHNSAMILDKNTAFLDLEIPTHAFKSVYLGARVKNTPENNEFASYVLQTFPSITFAKCRLDPKTWNIRASAITKKMVDTGMAHSFLL